jgi:DUSAM domain-containing protein
MSQSVDAEQARTTMKEDWARLRELESQLQRGEPLELTDTTRELLKRTAVQVALSSAEAERGLRSAPEAAALLGEIRRRIREGSERVGQAILDTAVHVSQGNTRSARRGLEAALAVEVVPYYRESLEALLDWVETLKP